MAVTIKTKKEIAILREGGRRLAVVLRTLAGMVNPGMTGEELETTARELIEKGGDRASFLGYRGRKDTKPYPAALCLSINTEVVHAPLVDPGALRAPPKER